MNKVRTFSEVLTPEHIVKQMCDLVPKEYYSNKEIIFVEPSCGTGNILQEIIERRLLAGLSTQEVEQSTLAFELQQENVFITKNKIKEKFGVNINVVCGNTLELLKQQDKTKEYVVIQNPPYNASGNINYVKVIYPDHIFAIIKELNPELLISIHPHKYAIGSKGGDKLREYIISCKKVEELIIYSKGSQVFPDVVTGPIQIMKWNKNHNSNTCKINGVNQQLNKYDIIPLSPLYYSIIDKVKSKTKTGFVSETCKPQNWYGISSGFTGWCNKEEPDAIPCLHKRGEIKYIKYSDVKRPENIVMPSLKYGCGNIETREQQTVFMDVLSLRTSMHSNDYENIGNCVTVPRNPIAGQEEVYYTTYPANPIAGNEWHGKPFQAADGRFTDKTNEQDFAKPITIYSFLTKYFEGNHIKKNPYILEPGTICSETYIILNSLKSYEEAQNFQKYMLTKFFRFMVLTRVASQNMTRRVYRWVPQMEHYNKEWTDEELYKMFDLTQDEINIIESKIKAYNTPKTKHAF